MEALDDRVTPDRSQFLLEFIRRNHNRPLTIKNHHRDTSLHALLTLFDRGRVGAAISDETLPLPLSPDVWITHVFSGRESPNTLLGAIVRSRSASWLYCGLLALDDATRAWLESEPSLIADIATRYAAAFLVAAPALRIEGDTQVLPGGPAAAPAWEALVGRRTTEPAAFIRAVLGREEGRMAYYLAAMAALTSGQLRFALALDADAQLRVAAVRRLHAVFARVSAGWRVDDNAFWRPMVDPALLASNLPTDAAGLPLLTGTRDFWTAVLPGDDGYKRGSNGDGAQRSPSSAVVDFGWLCEHVFTGHRVEDRRRYELVLLAMRFAPRAHAKAESDVVAALRASYTYPTLSAALERAGLRDAAAIVAAARRAATLDAIEDDGRAARALAQFQGALVLLTHAAVRGGMTADTLAKQVLALSAVELNDRGEYDGRLVRWFTAWLDSHLHGVPGATELDVVTAGPVEHDTLMVLAGSLDVDPRFVEWEGTRYRIDFSRAEAVRMARLIGEHPLPFLTSARTLVVMADVLAQSDLSVERLKSESSALAQLAVSVALDRPESWRASDASRQYADAHAMLQRAARAGDVRSAARVAPGLRGLADELFARGLREATYARALGQAERSSISADEAAQRHDFGVSAGVKRTAAWAPPVEGSVPARGWHVFGSLLGLDLRLAKFGLMPLSSKPPLRRPTLEDDHRRVFIETTALMNPVPLKDADRDAIVAAMRKGRARVAAVRTPDEAAALGDEIRLSPARRTLLIWLIERAPETARSFLSPLELLWLGVGQTRMPASFDAWGVSADGRLGCACLDVLDRQPWEMLAGRWHSGILASGFPDLNLRLAELLTELHMPASLLAPVLASATLDFVDNTAARDPDDRRALVDWVQALRPERVEQYLALLTAGGPLVPVETGGGE